MVNVAHTFVENGSTRAKDRKDHQSNGVPSKPLKTIPEMFIGMVNSYEGKDGFGTMVDGGIIAFKLTVLPGYVWGVKTLEDLERANAFMEKPYYLFPESGFTFPGPKVIKKAMVLHFKDFTKDTIADNTETKLIDNEGQLKEFVQIISQSWDLPLLPSLEMWKTSGCMETIVSYVDGKMVGGLFLQLDGNTSCVYFVSTLPEWRGRGIGKALMSYAIKLASSRGGSGMVLYATPMGEPLYLSLGFTIQKCLEGTIVDPNQAPN